MNLPTILALDTSVKNVSLALFQNGELKSFRHEIPLESQSAVIISIIDDELKKAQATLADVDDVIFCHGPGSFTSLRVGLATLKGLFTGTQTKLRVASSLLLRCLSLPETAGPRVASIKMGRDRVMVGVLDSSGFHESLMSLEKFGVENLNTVDVVTVAGFENIFKSKQLQVISWFEAVPHYLMAPDIG